MQNYKTIAGLSLKYYPLQNTSIKTPNINNRRVKWKDKDYGLPDTWHKDIKNYGITLSGLLIIDIDNKHPDGIKITDQEKQECKYSLPRLKTLLNILPLLADAYVEITQSGGFHIWTRKVEGFDRKQIDIGENSIDLLTGSNFLACANTNSELMKWKPGSYAVYNESDNIPQLSMTQLEIIISLYGNKPSADVVPIKENAQYFLELDIIPNGSRDKAMFQIMTYWFKQGLTLEEAREEYNKLSIDRTEEFELDDEYAFEVKYAGICAKEAGKNENRLAWARENLLYIRQTDDIYYVPDRLVKTYENIKKRHRELFPNGQMTADGKPKYSQLVDIWMDLPDRLMVDDQGFCPIADPVFTFNKRQYCNTYTDQRYKPWGEAVSAEDQDIKLYLQMISNLVENDERTMSLYLSSLSHKLNNLESHQMWAWYFITPEKGVGKGLSWDIQAKLNGNYGQKVGPEKMTNQFNSFKFTTLNVLVDEADDINKKINGINAMNALKMLITDNFDTVHNKGKDVGMYQMPIYSTVEMHSNHADRLKIDNGERRVAIVYCRSKPMANEDYNTLGKVAFPAVHATDLEREISDKFYSKLTRYLMDYTAHEDFNLERAPSTKWKSEVCDLSRDKFTSTLVEAFSSDNAFVKSDLQTQHSLRLMLQQEYGYKKLLDKELSIPMEELEREGIVITVKEKFANLERIDAIDNGYDVAITKHKHRGNPRLYAIRNHDEYIGQSTKVLRQHFYPFAKESDG